MRSAHLERQRKCSVPLAVASVNIAKYRLHGWISAAMKNSDSTSEPTGVKSIPCNKNLEYIISRVDL